jgi:hypothetical protein
MAGFLVFLLFMQSCSFLKEMTALKKCEFRMTTLEDPRLAGVDVSRVKSFGDIGMVDMGSISMSIMKGELPLSFTLNVEARNPNPATAALNRIEYIAFIDDVEVATGAMDKRIEIPPNGGVSTIPIPLQTDLLEVLSGDSRQALINFGLNLADAGDRPTRVGLKVKPTILIGSLAIDYPGYLTVSYEFSSGN